MSQWLLFMEYMLILDAIWPIIERQIPEVRDPNKSYQRKPGAGRPRTNNRILVNTILYALMTGTQWNAIFPDKDGYLCKGKTAHKWLMIWGKQGFFENLHKAILELFDCHTGLKVLWTSIDGALYKAPLGQELVGPNPTDRGKLGGKRSLCVDESGIILVMVHAGANVHDCRLLEPTLKALRKIVPEGTEVHICLDAGYVGYEEVVKSYGFIPHIRPRGEEKKMIENNPNFKAKRWIVEVMHSFLNQFRKLKVRYEKLSLSHTGLSMLASSIITLRTIFRKELGEDSFWYNKEAKKKGLQPRFREIDLSKYGQIGENLLQDAIACNIYTPLQ